MYVITKFNDQYRNGSKCVFKYSPLEYAQSLIPETHLKTSFIALRTLYHLHPSILYCLKVSSSLLNINSLLYTLINVTTGTLFKINLSP